MLDWGWDLVVILVDTVEKVWAMALVASIDFVACRG